MIDCKEERSTRFCQIFAAALLSGQRSRINSFFSKKIFSAVATQGRSDDEEEDFSLLPLLSGLVSILKEGIVVFALGHILGRVALLGELVVDEAELAALLARGDPVQADVELGTVVGVGVLGMGVELAELIGGSLLGAGEPVVGLVGVGLAILPVGDLGPVAHAAVLVEPEPRAAGVLLGGAVDAGVEDVAHAGVGVGVEPVQTGAQVAGTLGGLEFQSVATVDIEVMITRLPLPAEGVKDEAIWAQPVLWDVVEAVVVFVALNRVGEVAVPLGTSEV